MQWNEQNYTSRLRSAEKIAAEGMQLGHEPSAYEKSLIYGPNKRPHDLRDFSELAKVRFKDGKYRTIWRQKAASKTRKIAIIAELNARYLKILNAPWDETHLAGAR